MESKDNQKRNPKASEQSFSLLKKPLIPQYTCLPEALPSKRSAIGQETEDEDIPIPGFKEFRKYKRVNETRVITSYKPESAKKEIKKKDSKAHPLIEIEDADKFLLEKIKTIPVESLEGLLQMIHSYPDLGYVTMNRCHMDLINDYQPYNYTICNYNDIDKANYATISLNGVLEIYKGDADFMALDRLLVEYELYNALKKIPLFSSLNFWKAFMVWFKKIRRRKFMDAKGKIEAFFDEKYKSHENNKNH